YHKAQAAQHHTAAQHKPGPAAAAWRLRLEIVLLVLSLACGLNRLGFVLFGVHWRRLPESRRPSAAHKSSRSVSENVYAAAGAVLRVGEVSRSGGRSRPRPRL